MSTAALLVIGNEILSGKVRDTNSTFLAIELRKLGVDLERIVTIPDVIDTIARETRALARASRPSGSESHRLAASRAATRQSSKVSSCASSG